MGNNMKWFSTIDCNIENIIKRNDKSWGLVFYGWLFCLWGMTGTVGIQAQESPDQTKAFTIGTELDYPPFSFVDENGRPAGFNVELSQAIAEVMGEEIEIRIEPWSDIRTDLQSGTIDVIAGMYFSKEREEDFDFSPPFAQIHHSAFARKDTPKIQSEQDLRGKNIIVMRGDIMHDYVLKKELTDDLLLTNTLADALRLLASGEGEYALAAKLPGLYWMKELGLSNIRSTGPLFHPSGYCFAVREEDSDLLSHIVEGLSILKRTGRYNEITHKWLGVIGPWNGQTWKIIRYAAYVLVFMIVLLLAALIWIRSLRTMVAMRTRDLEQEILEHQKSKNRIEHINQVLKAIRNVNQLITKEKDSNRLLEQTCELLIETRGYFNCWIVLFDDENRSREIYQAGFNHEFDSLKRQLAADDFPRCVHKSLAESSIHVFEDPSVTCPECPLSPWYADSSGISVRLEHGDRVYGVMTVSTPRNYAEDREEHQLLGEIASDIAFALFSFESEQKRRILEDQLLQSQKMEAIGTLAGGVAHDFNNILMAILGYSRLVLNQLQPSDSIYEDLEEIHSAGERAASLTNQLLAFSRKQIIQPEIVDLNRLILDFEKMLRRMLGEDIQIEITADPELGRIKIDPGQMDQVIMNLAVNARDAMPAGGKFLIETKNVEFDREYTDSHLGAEIGDYILLSFSDTGCGMSKDVQSKIFDPFFTTKKKGKGSGLGLSTVYGIVKQNSGYIMVYSEPGKGTTFKLYFPRISETEEKQEREIASVHDYPGSETILVVEDESNVRQYIYKSLSTNGYRVLLAGDYEEAFRVLASSPEPVDLLITDVVLPGASGKIIADDLVRKQPHVKVIFMSGYTDNAIVHHNVLDKEVNFLSKPFPPEVLLRKVRKILDAD